MADAKSKNAVKTGGKATFLLQYYRSMIATPEKHRRVIRGLGFTRLNQIVEREDTPSIRGMAFKVRHLVTVEPVEDTGAQA